MEEVFIFIMWDRFDPLIVPIIELFYMVVPVADPPCEWPPAELPYTPLEFASRAGLLELVT